MAMCPMIGGFFLYVFLTTEMTNVVERLYTQYGMPRITPNLPLIVYDASRLASSSDLFLPSSPPLSHLYLSSYSCIHSSSSIRKRKRK